MKLNVRGIAMFVPPDGSSHGPGGNLQSAVRRAVESVLAPLRIKGLSEIAPVVIIPSPKRAPPVAILGLRLAGGKATCRFMLSPPVPSASPKWPAYRVVFVEEQTRKLARRVTTREAPLPGSRAWLAESRRRIRLAPAKATPRVKRSAGRVVS